MRALPCTSRVSRLALVLLSAALCLRLAIAGPSLGCGNDDYPSNGGFTLKSKEGIDREYRLYKPPNYDPNSPHKLLLAFHGWGESSNAFLYHRKFKTNAKKYGFIVASPSGLSDNQYNLGDVWMKYRSWTFSGSSSGINEAGNPICATPSSRPSYNYNSCSQGQGNSNNCAWTHCASDDAQFTLDLVKHLGSSLCIDESNVFAMGGSNGGMFTWELGQNPVTAGTFRAIAPLIGLPHEGFLVGKGKPGDLPVILMTGMRDKTVPPGQWGDNEPTESYDGGKGYFYESATAVTMKWSADHGCGVQGEPRTLKKRRYGLKARGFRCKSWCVDGPEDTLPLVVDCRKKTLGHDYNIAQTSAAIFQFFEHHSV